MADGLQKRISDSIATGAALSTSFAEVIALAKDPSGPVIQVTIDVNRGIDALDQLAGLIQGGSIAAIVPKTLLPSGPVSIQSVEFTLFTATQTIGEIGCIVAFGQNGQGVTWDIAKIGSAQLSVTLQTIILKWITPGSPGQFVVAAASGETKLGSLQFDVAVSYPQPTITFTQSATVNLGDFFQQIGLPPVEFLQQLLLDEFELVFAFSQSLVSLSTQVAAEGDTGVTLIPAPNGPAILAFERMALNFSSAAGAVDASIQGQLLVLGYIALGVEAAHGADGSWSFSGNIDIPATWVRLHPDTPPPPDNLFVTVADFARIVAPGSNPPDALKTFGIAQLSVDYSYPKGGSSAYTLTGVFDGEWTIGGDLKAQVTVVLSNSGNSLSAEFDIDGISFMLGYKFGAGANEIDARIDAGDVLSLSGTYDINAGIVTLHFDKGVQFRKLIAWLVGEVTGNRYFALPSPWDEVLARVSLPPGSALSFTIDTKKKSIVCQYTLSDPIGFLAFKLKGVEIGYNSSKKAAGGSGLTVKIDTDLPKEITIGEWDPGTQQPPKVPGSTGALFEIKLLGAGQHIGFNSPPTTVETAVTQLAQALDPNNWTSGLYPKTQMSFSKDVGWLIGSQVVILERVDIKFIFNDPIVYGLSITVSKPPEGAKPSALDILIGLFAEILYRKVSDTIGVYDGTLTLPDRIRKLELGVASVTLPQISLAIYTNGAFKIDIGFPYNRNFSRSCAVSAGQYAGAGGVYYAKLDGLNPSELPQVNSNYGVFNPITEIGIGFEIGVARGFSSGPLTASFSVMLQGIFEGTFAKFSVYATGEQDEYFAVKATLAIVGHLIGKLDFAIITASLEITVYVEVDLTLIAHRQAVANVSVGVSIALTVSINCGIFSINIHCSYSTTISAQAVMGENTTALWDGHPPQGLALAMRATMPALDAAPPLLVGWQPIADTNPLTAYFIPQLTAGLAYPQSDGKTYWYYVGQLALANPAATAKAGAALANDGDASYARFVRGMLRWALYAIGRQTNLDPVPAATADAAQVLRDDVSRLVDVLGAADHGTWPQLADVKAQFKASFQTHVTRLAGANDANFGVGFFPSLPGMSVSIAPVGGAARLLAPAQISLAHLQAVKRSGNTGAPPTTFLAHLDARARVAAAAPQSIAEHLTIEFAMLAVRSGLQKILDADIMPASNPIAIGDVLARLDDTTLGSISGMTTRFMLHGTRQPAEGNDATALEPLYALTGQQALLTAADLAAADLSMTLAFTSGAPADWGVDFDGGGSSLTLSSADSQPAVFKPKTQIPPAPAFDPGTVTAAPMQVAHVQPARFYLTTGIKAGSGDPGIWLVPQPLADHLAQSATDAFSVSYVTKNSDGSYATPVPTVASFVFAVDFRVQRIPMTEGPGGPLPNTYQLFDVDQGGIGSLQTLVTQIGAGQTPVTALAIAYATEPSSGASGTTTSREAVITPIDFSRTFIVQSNFSTETRPPQVARQAAAAPSAQDPTRIASFLNKLWTSGITNSGGYYLFDAPPQGQSGFPDTLFDRGGIATLTLVATLNLPVGTDPVVLPAYVTGVRTPDHPVGGSGALFVASATLADVHPLLPPGHVGIEITRTPPADPGKAGAYGGSLDHLYNLITAESVTIDGTVVDRTGLPPVFGPLDPDGAGDPSTWRFTHVFPLVGSADGLPPSPTPPPTLNPYLSVGRSAAFGLFWTDIFGNEWGPVAAALQADLKYLDPLVSLSQLPYLAIDYIFDGRDGAAQLAFGFVVKPPVYVLGDDTRKANDLATYAKAYYQLVATPKGGEVIATATTSLVTATGSAVPAPIAIDVATIRSNIETIYGILVDLPVGGAAPADPAPITLPSVTVAVPPGGTQLNALLLFPLTVDITFTRTGPIADGFPADGPVKTITFAIAPRSLGTETDPQSLTAFADAFETAFTSQSLVVAVGPRPGEGLTAKSDQVWAVRYGAAGLSITFPDQPGSPAYFAPKPLDNVLRSRAVSVRAVENDGNLGAASTVAVADVDLDAQMQKFLTAVDTMFSATDAIPTALVNTSAINDLSTRKKAIVEQLVGYVTDLATGTSYGGGSFVPTDPIYAAADRYRQECLIRMGAFYDMNAAAVAAVQAAFGAAADPHLNVFGHPTQPTDTDAEGEKEFSLTSGKCPLSTTANPMAIGLFAKHVSEFKQYVGDPSFQIDAIEHDIERVTVEGMTYQVGSWLKFVKPRAGLAMPKLTIPIPLRAFPQPPQLIRQYAVELSADPDIPPTSDPNVQLKLAKSWSLNGSYQHAYAAQDTVHLDVQINLGLGGTARPRALPGKDLLDTLVEFNQIYPQLQAIFTREKLSSIRTPEDAQKATTLKNALQSFATLVDDVATCSWTLKAQPVRTAALPTGLVGRETRYAIEDGYGVNRPTDIWRARVTFERDVGQPVNVWPQLQIDGYRTVVDAASGADITYKFEDRAHAGTFLDAETAFRIATRTVAVVPAYSSTAFSPLDIVDRQNGLLAMMIGRNEDLPASFHYETPWVSYTETLAPTLDTSLRINVAGIGQPNGQPAPRSVAAHLTALFAALTKGAGEPQPVKGSFQAASFFAYPASVAAAARSFNLALVDLPIALRLPTEIDFDAPVTGTPDYVTTMANTINDWLTSNGLSAAQQPALWQRSEIRFDLSLFSSVSETGRPILRLRDLFIPCAQIV